MLLTELLSLKGGCRGWSESTQSHVKMPHCWKSHATAHTWLMFRITPSSSQGTQSNRWFCQDIQMKFSMFSILQRSKFIRKPLGGSRSGTTAVIPDSEYRNLSTLLETEAERNRILNRNGFSTNASNELRTDSITPGSNQNRTLSASGQRKNSGMYF